MIGSKGLLSVPNFGDAGIAGVYISRAGVDIGAPKLEFKLGKRN